MPGASLAITQIMCHYLPAVGLRGELGLHVGEFAEIIKRRECVRVCVCMFLLSSARSERIDRIVYVIRVHL